MTLAPCALALLLAPGAPSAAEPLPEPWRTTLVRLAQARDALERRLTEEVHAPLRARIAAERPDLLPRISPAQPSAKEYGYGLLPPLEPDPPEEAPPPSETRHELGTLSAAAVAELGRAAELAARIAYRFGDLGALLDEYAARVGQFQAIDARLRYHREWQPAAVERAAYFAGRNELLRLYRDWLALKDKPGEEAAAQALRARLDDSLLDLKPTPGLRWEPEGGSRAMRVRLATDIQDEGFLAAFAGAVERTWNGSPAMKEAGLRIGLEWDRRDPKALYPEGVPARGAKLDSDAHLNRFGPGLVLTTGAESLYALQGRAVVVGPDAAVPRQLAHEFGHLLGFNDGYLHAFDGSPSDPDGVLWLEVTPFPEDLLSSSRTGRVTPGMARKLLAAYP